jgi:hypothetical protein
MTSPTAEVAKADDLKAVLETIAGHEIDASTEQLRELISFVVPVGSYAFTPLTENEIGRVISRNLLFGNVPPTCAKHRLLDVSGFSTTSGDGNRSFLVGDFICPEESSSLTYNQPINVVATPVSRSPFFLTATADLVFQPGLNFATNVRITVFAWDANGAAAPNILFHWRCRVRSETPIF